MNRNRSAQKSAMADSTSPMKTPLVLLIVMAAGACFAPSTRGQITELTVRSALDVALERRPELQAGRAQVDVARARRLGALPVTGPSVMFTREGIPNGNGGFGEQRFVLTQNVPMPWSVSAAWKAGGSELDALKTEMDVVRAQIVEEVKSAYVDVLHAQEMLRLRERAVDLGNQLLNTVQLRIDAGEAAHIDLLKAQLQEAEARDLLDESERAFETARYGLFRAVGLDPDDQRYSIVFPDALNFVDVLVDQEAVTGRITELPSVRKADLQIEAARHRASGARFETLPAMTVGYMPQDFGTGYTFHAWEVGLRLPILEWLGRGTSRREARARVRLSTQERELALQAVKEDMERRWHSYDISRQTIIRYEDSLRGRGEELVALTQEGYNLGELDLLTLLDAQRTFVASQVRYLDALRNYHRDLIRLERYAGRALSPLE